jgi:hypothetical protein
MQLAIQHATDPTHIARYTINDVIDHGTWFALLLTPLQTTGWAFASDDSLTVVVC